MMLISGAYPVARQFWAVGGECLDPGFMPHRQDEDRILGPFPTFGEAEEAWREREAVLGQRYVVVTAPPMLWRRTAA